VKAGEPLGEMPVAAAAPAPAPAPAAPAVVAAAPQPAAALPEIDLAAAPPAPAPETLTPAPAAPVEIAPEGVPIAAPAEALPTLEFPALEIPAAELPSGPALAEPAADDEDIVAVGDARLSTSLYGIFLDETQTHLDTLAAGRRRLEEGENVSEDIERAAHTLAGIAGTVKFDAMKDLGHSLEGLLERLLGKPAGPAGRVPPRLAAAALPTCAREDPGLRELSQHRGQRAEPAAAEPQGRVSPAVHELPPGVESRHRLQCLPPPRGKVCTSP
jgi:HPt (histidine-containing phosphotransfer) domain-containing protein